MIKHLTDENCNICGAETKSILVSNKHIMTGEYKESREYECGKIITYYPNFKEYETIRTCRESKEFKDMINKRNKAVIKLKNYINRLDVDDNYKNHILNSLDIHI